VGDPTTHAYVDALAAKLGRQPTEAEIRTEKARIDAAFNAGWAAYEATWTDEERARVARATQFTPEEERDELVRSLIMLAGLVAVIAATTWLFAVAWHWVVWVLIIAAGVVLGGLVLGVLAAARR